MPWHDHVVAETTDLGVDDNTFEPVPLDEEIGFILTNAAKYLSKTPSRSDILSVYAGLRRSARPASSLLGQSRQFAAGESPCVAEPSPAGLFATQPMNI